MTTAAFALGFIVDISYRTRLPSGKYFAAVIAVCGNWNHANISQLTSKLSILLLDAIYTLIRWGNIV